MTPKATEIKHPFGKLAIGLALCWFSIAAAWVLAHPELLVTLCVRLLSLGPQYAVFAANRITDQAVAEVTQAVSDVADTMTDSLPVLLPLNFEGMVPTGSNNANCVSQRKSSPGPALPAAFAVVGWVGARYFR